MLSGKTPTAASLPLPLLVSLCLLLLVFPVASVGNYSCPNSWSCGHLTAISYPFWFASDPNAIDDYCGYLDFMLVCQDNIPILRYANYSYRVISIAYDDYTITLADADVFNLSTYSCPKIQHNFTLLADLAFNYTTFDVNLTFFFDCTDGPPNYRIPCFNRTGDNRSYVFREDEIPVNFDLPRVCNDTFVAPVLQSNLQRFYESMDENYGGMLQSGFQLKWSEATTGNCRDCESSKGRCGLSKTSNGASAFTCFCSDGVSEVHKCGRKKKSRLKIGIAIVVILAVASIFFLFCILHLTKHNRKDNQATEAVLLQFAFLAPKRYKYSEIKRMTKSFSTKLGQGGYGSVFKGSLQDGHLVAVKVLSESKGNGEEFVNEVVSISRASHVNVVSLLGFCLERSKMALVYDFMPNGSLEKFIFSDESGAIKKLGWDKMYEIALGIARGLEYLHRGCNTRIVHFDIKPHNILLDQNFHPKISDFGLAKLCPQRESAISMMAARGTPGYIAPELISRNFGVVSTKSDVYSYGMMVLEMVGGRKNLDSGVENTSEIYFPLWIHDNLDRYCNSQVSRLTAETEELARKMIIVGLWCIQLEPDKRPPMSVVVDMFEGSTKDLEMPPRPCP